MALKLFFLICIMAQATNVFAHPVPYKGAIGVMTWNQSFMSDNWLTYSFHSRAAIAARNMRFEVPEGRMKFYAPQLDYLVKRWNELNSQTNVYAYGAYGPMSMSGQTKAAGLLGLEADAESRKYYVSAKYEKMWSKLGPGFYHVEGRIGAAPYEAEFNEVASWFMIQYQWHPMLVSKDSLTPLIRLFYKNVLLEVGVSTKAEWMTNFMFHF